MVLNNKDYKKYRIEYKYYMAIWVGSTICVCIVYSLHLLLITCSCKGFALRIHFIYK